MVESDKSLLFDYYDSKTILITGASGYIAWNLIKYINDFNCTIICFSRNTNNINKQINKSKIIFVEGSYTDFHLLKKIVRNVDIIFHLASQTSVYESEKRPIDDYKANVKPMQLLLEACRVQQNYPTIVFSGTSTQCGIKEKLPIDENVTDDPITTYDFHKLQAERWLKFYSKQNWIKGISLRLTNVFGPGPANSSSDRGVLNKMIKKAIKGQKLTIYGKGNYIRDYIYIDDVISAMIKSALNINKMKDRHFILGSGVGTAIKDAIKLIAKSTNNTMIEFVDPPKDLYLIESRNFIADISNINKSTGWSPKVNLLNGINLTLKSFTT